MSNKFLWLPLFSIALMTSLPVQAQIKANSMAISFAGGKEFFASKRQLNTSSLGSVALSYQFTPNIGVEGVVGFFSTHYKTFANYTPTVNGRLYLLAATYHFMPEEAFTPYLLLGTGVTNMNGPAYMATNQTNINAGAGIQYFLDEIVSVKLEARDLYTLNGGKNDILLMAGISFALNWC